MSMRFDTMLFPGGLSRAFTLSYDDGVRQDIRLAELFRKYGMKCTFNLNSGLFGDRPQIGNARLEESEIDECYAGQELGGHALYHSALDTVGAPRAAYEIIEDKRRLEQHSAMPLNMFAYPFGNFSDRVVEQLRDAGYEGARTVRSTGSFAIPTDFLRWDPTCHHGDERLMELAKEFVEGFSFGPRLFYVWGHAYEFDGADNWDVIENLCRFIDEHRDSIWICTNGEILRYVKAYRALEYFADGERIYNPSAVDVWLSLRLGGPETVAKIPAGGIWQA